MWNWLKSVASANKPPVSLPADQIDLLREDLGRLDALRGGISRRLMDFIVSGENDAVLGEAAALQGASAAVEMAVRSGWMKPQNFKVRATFFEKLDTDDVPFLLRLASVFDAISQTEPRDLKMAGLPPDAAWVEVFVMELVQCPRNSWPKKASVKTKIRAETLEAMFRANGQATDLLVRGALWVNPTKYWYGQSAVVFLSIPGIAGSFERHPGAIRESLGQKDHRARVHALEFLGKVKAPIGAVLDDIVQAGVAPAKQVQEAATTLLFGQLPACLPRLKEIAVNGENDERLRAVRLLWKLDANESRRFLQERANEDKSKKVMATIQELLVPMGENADEENTVKLDLPPPLPEVSPIAPLPADFPAKLESAFERASKAAEAGWERVKNEKWAKNQKPFMAPPVRKVVDFLEGRGGIDSQQAVINLPHWAGPEARKALNDVITHPDCTLLHAVRWCSLRVGNFNQHHYWMFHAQAILNQYARQRKISIDLREFAAALKAAGISPDVVGISFLSQNRHVRNSLFKVSPEMIWSYFGEHQEILEASLGLRFQDKQAAGGSWITSDYWIKQRRLRALEALATFPVPPGQFHTLLWELAFGSVKQDRLPAQEALARVPGKEAKIIAALGNGQQDVRANAADWIERLKLTSAIPALEAALKKEKSEVVKGALFDALEAMGVNLDPYLDRKKLADEAAKGLAKGIPKELDWFPFAQLRAVHWGDSGAAVPPNVLTWFMVQACKLKDPMPTPLLRRYSVLFKKSERAVLGKFILQAWITQDTLPAYTHDEAAAKADAGTKQMVAYVQKQRANPNMAKYYADWSEEKHYRAMLNGFLNACKGSATDSKGILAVAGACADGDVVPIVQRFLKQWYGIRHNQGKALVQMLSGVDHPAAIQLLLSVGNRFRTKGIQEEAARVCGLLAERKGWSLDELADRTIPTAGFDEHGVLELSYGTRTFTAKLGADFEIILQNQDGKEISSLPDPSKADDEAAAKESKQRLSAARKELKGILKLQIERLYEAMCTQRTWSFSDWNTYLNRHTIVGTYVQRLVWGVVENGAIIRLFRPLPDGSLTDEQDNAVELSPEKVIRLAHDALLTPEQRAAWTTHLSDYDITPLFAQFGRPKFELTQARQEESEIKDFQGYLIEAFKLRGRLTKQGYSRGAALDGGWWNTYEKRFLGLGIEATIEFSGGPMPEENRTVALISLGFTRLGEEGRSEGENIALGELPVVLLTECWNDLRAAAAEGTGFDPEWEKKCSY